MKEQGQLKLFPTRVQDVLPGLSLSPKQAEMLYQEGLLSFAPEPARTLLPYEQAELVFVGTLAGLPLSREAIATLFKSLDPPYAYSHDRIYYDWPRRRWRNFSERLKEEEDRPKLTVRVEWPEVEPLAQKIFFLRPGREALTWAEAAWGLVLQEGLATYNTDVEHWEAWIRFLVLGELYLDFYRQAWQRDAVFDYAAWGKEIGLDLLQIILMIGPEPVTDLQVSEEEAFSLGLRQLMAKARGELLSVLKKGSGGSKPLFLSLWRIAHTDQALSVTEIFKGLTPTEREALKWLEQICRND